MEHLQDITIDKVFNPKTTLGVKVKLCPCLSWAGPMGTFSGGGVFKA